MCFIIHAGFGWGDPHFDSLDGLQYTFNGWGEFVLYKLLDSDQEQFAVQARTQPVNASDSTAATMFSAIAAGIPNTSYVEVSIVQVFSQSHHYLTTTIDNTCNYTDLKQYVQA